MGVLLVRYRSCVGHFVQLKSEQNGGIHLQLFSDNNSESFYATLRGGTGISIEYDWINVELWIRLQESYRYRYRSYPDPLPRMGLVTRLIEMDASEVCERIGATVHMEYLLTNCPRQKKAVARLVPSTLKGGSVTGRR